MHCHVQHTRCDRPQKLVWKWFVIVIWLLIYSVSPFETILLLRLFTAGYQWLVHLRRQSGPTCIRRRWWQLKWLLVDGWYSAEDKANTWPIYAIVRWMANNLCRPGSTTRQIRSMVRVKRVGNCKWSICEGFLLLLSWSASATLARKTWRFIYEFLMDWRYV